MLSAKQCIHFRLNRTRYKHINIPFIYEVGNLNFIVCLICKKRAAPMREVTHEGITWERLILCSVLLTWCMQLLSVQIYNNILIIQYRTDIFFISSMPSPCYLKVVSNTAVAIPSFTRRYPEDLITHRYRELHYSQGCLWMISPLLRIAHTVRESPLNVPLVSLTF